MIANRVITVIYRLLMAANVVSAIGMVGSGYAYLIDPVKFPLIATADMLFPVFVVVNFLFLLLWLLLDRKSSLLSILAFVVCYSPMKTYMGINLPSEVPSGAIKVMSYNVYNFHGMQDEFSEDTQSKLVDFLVNADCDILCLQESFESALGDSCKKRLNDKYPYSQFTLKEGGKNSIAIYSKYKILSSDTIAYKSECNLSAAYILDMPAGKTLLVNNHLEASHLSLDDRNNFKNIVTGDANSDSISHESKNIISTLTKSSLIRNAQVKAVSEYISRHIDMPIILCGDFNDTPTSFNHSVMNRNLTDCYIATGIGPGWSYCHSGLRVRIDNIMCSSHFDPYGCKVLSNVNYSDHYPIVCWLTSKGKRN